MFFSLPIQNNKRTDFLALPLGGLAFAQQMTERANPASSYQNFLNRQS